MRVTTSVLTEQALAAARAALWRLGRTQAALATGRRIQSPADDPAGHAAATRLTARLGALAQWGRQADQARTALADAEHLLGRIQPLLGRAQELAVTGADASRGPAERRAIAAEVNEILEELASLANGQAGGRYLLGGRETLTPPLAVTRDGAGRIVAAAWNPRGVDAPVEVGLGPGLTVRINVGGTEALGADTHPAFLPGVLVALRDALLADDPEAVRATLADLGAAQSRLGIATAEVGTRLRFVDQVQGDLEADRLAAETARAAVLDADLAQAAADLARQETAYQAALQVMARTIQPSLVEFLR